MKGAVLYAPREMKIEETRLPKINADEILVEVKAAAICGSDLRVFLGEKKALLPRTIGHEFAGEVVEVGREADGLHVGDRITMEPVVSCGKCFNCLRGRANICVNRKVVGYHYDGCFAEYIRIPQEALNNLVKIPKELSFEAAALAEPFAACLNGLLGSNLSFGDSVAIIGAGPIGLMHLQLCRSSGAGEILISDPRSERLEIAKKLGATYMLNPKEESVAKFVGEKIKDGGFDLVMVTVGIPEVVEGAISLAKTGGTVTIFAGNPPKSRIGLDPNVIHYKEITLRGSESSNVEHLRRVVESMALRRIDPESLITHKLPLKELVRGIDMKHEAVGLKVLIVPSM